MWNYHRDDVNESADGNNEEIILEINNSNTTKGDSFKYNIKLIESTPNNGRRLDAEVVVPLKRLSNFWRSLNLSLINCERKLDLSWTRYCVISEISRPSRAVPNTGPVRDEVATTTNSAKYQINNAQPYVPVLSLLTIISNF